jgi:curli biogenesis system outer membrane secretion channel CsgG
MNETTGILIAVAIGLLLAATLLLLMVPEPPERAVIATERLDVAVLAFRNSSSWAGAEETLSSRIEAKLVNAPGINVFSRTQLDTLLIERALSTTGLIDPATAVEIGTLTGVSKLITGTVYAVDTQAEDTTLCVAWENGICTENVPAKRYTARTMAQIEIVDTQTGRIERAVDVAGADDTTVRSDIAFGGFDSLLVTASNTIADQVLGAVTSAYTRELRYGLYKEVESKRNGYVGTGATNRFSQRDGAVHLITHFTRVKDKDSFDLEWLTPEGTSQLRVEDIVSAGTWRHYQLEVTDLASGRYRVQGFLNGTLAFDEPFTVSP